MSATGRPDVAFTDPAPFTSDDPSGQPSVFRSTPNTKSLTALLLAVWTNGLPVIFAVVTLTFDPYVAEVELVV